MNSNLNLNVANNTVALNRVETLESLSKYFGSECFVDYTEMDYDYIEGSCYAVCYKDKNFDGFTEFTNYVECNNQIILQSELHTSEQVLSSTTLRVYRNSLQEQYDADGNEIVHIFNSEKFETKNICECYNADGQQIGCYDAGCSSIENSSFFTTKLDEDDFDTKEEYDVAVRAEFDEMYGFDEHNTVSGYDYWDGSNWKTLTIKGSDSVCGDNEGLEELDEKLQAKILLQFENKEFESEGYGTETYKSEDFTFNVLNFSSNPFIADVVL